MWTTLGLGVLLALIIAARVLHRMASKGILEPVNEESLSFREVAARRERRRDAEVTAQTFAWASWGLLLVFVLILLANSVKIVGANEVGVPRTLGKIGSPLQSGPHLVAPWTEVEKLPTRPKSVTEVSVFRTNESGDGRIRTTTRWQTDKQDAAELYQQARTSDEDKIEKEIIKPQVDGAVSEYYGTRTNVEAANGKYWPGNVAVLTQKIQARLSNYGIHLVDVQIREVAPGDNMNRALGQVAAQDAKTALATKQDETANKEAIVRLTEATGIKNAAAQLKDLSDEQVRLLCLQAAERVMNANTAKGIPTYVTPCGSGSTSVIAK